MRLIVAVLAVALLASACNTVRGVGRDLESVGRTVENSAD
jgi:predicted small secreted protein